MATSRHIVDRRVAEHDLEILAAKAARLPLGNPIDQRIAVGPLINQRQFDRVSGIVSTPWRKGQPW